MVNAIDVAKYLLARANQNGDLITNLKLQKLLYYAQAWYLVNHNRRLFRDPIKAWDLGPVVPSVYRKWKKYGASPIPYEVRGKEENCFDPHQIDYLDEFYRIFSNFSATALVSMSHSEKPWQDAHARRGNSEIDTKSMKEFYTKLYEEKYDKGQ